MGTGSLKARLQEFHSRHALPAHWITAETRIATAAPRRPCDGTSAMHPMAVVTAALANNGNWGVKHRTAVTA